MKDKKKKHRCEWCRKMYNPEDVKMPYFNEFRKDQYCSRSCYYDYMGSDPIYDGGGNTY